MKLLIPFALFCILLINTESYAQPVFAIGKENRKFLEYYQFWNGFDSSVVRYVFGEVRITTPTTTLRIPPASALEVGQRIQEGPEQGTSATLQNLARTEEFVIPNTGTIDYYGQLLSYRSPCDEEVTPPEPGEGPNRPVVGWGIVDITEFAIELVDAYTHHVLTTIDVVGVRPPTSVLPAVDTRYGGEYTKTVHSYAIPTVYAGKRAYIRISPRRYGPSPYGMFIGKQREWISLSSLYKGDGTSLSQDSVYALSDMFFQQTLDYCDSIQAATGIVPDQEDEVNKAWDEERFTIFMNRYYNTHTDIHGRVTHYTPKSSSSAKRGKPVMADSLKTIRVMRSVNDFIYFTVSQSIVQGGSITVTLYGGDMQKGFVRLVSTSGADLGELWSGTIDTSPQEISMTLPATLASGQYILVLTDYGGRKLASAKCIVEK